MPCPSIPLDSFSICSSSSSSYEHIFLCVKCVSTNRRYTTDDAFILLLAFNLFLLMIWKAERQRFFIRCFILQMPKVARAGPGSSSKVSLGFPHSCQGSECLSHHLLSPRLHTGKQLALQVQVGFQPQTFQYRIQVHQVHQMLAHSP